MKYSDEAYRDEVQEYVYVRRVYRGSRSADLGCEHYLPYQTIKN